MIRGKRDKRGFITNQSEERKGHKRFFVILFLMMSTASESERVLSVNHTYPKATYAF